MPRKARIYLPEIPCHIIQRGNNREACFFTEQDYQFYLECLYDATKRYGVSVHAYVLMTNHVHLLMTPQLADAISIAMQSVGRRYVQYINKEYHRSGTLWEGRHKSSLVDAEHYLLTCMRYIELNPMRAGMVNHPGEYPWSSYCCNAQGEENRLISCHNLYQALGLDEESRVQGYRALFDTKIPDGDVHLIRKAVMFSMPTGNNRFKEQIEKVVNRKPGYAKRGRPSVE